MLDPYKYLIDAILRADLDAPRKKRHTAKRVFDRLVDEHGMDHVSYGRVRDYAPGNKRMDRSIKPGLYAEAHIPSYWRLEFDPAPSLVVSELYGARYREVVTATTGVITRIRLPFPIEIDPGTLHRA
ncbi:hypothetical protein ABIA33_000426 [Streptacidiphilus sp. MAP12-16]|uniref:hypothetical protein n=1 Tax=Streptacidiphilus sp. MAP12-16 TaxID=3156300 RepID=UPI0035127AEA